MKISLIVPAFNEAGLLRESLARLRESAEVLHERGWTTELIVCDNNSTDATARIARAERPSSPSPSIRSPGPATAEPRWRRAIGCGLSTRIPSRRFDCLPQPRMR